LGGRDYAITLPPRLTTSDDVFFVGGEANIDAVHRTRILLQLWRNMDLSQLTEPPLIYVLFGIVIVGSYALLMLRSRPQRKRGSLLEPQQLSIDHLKK
jgi:hypothetical protein